MAYEPVQMRRFVMDRREDVSGTSGEGIVVEGVQFTDGTVVLRWRSGIASTVIWPNIDAAMIVHGHGDSTRLVWLDPPMREDGGEITRSNLERDRMRVAVEKAFREQGAVDLG